MVLRAGDVGGSLVLLSTQTASSSVLILVLLQVLMIPMMSMCLSFIIFIQLLKMRHLVLI
jgi:hypothetical protein